MDEEFGISNPIKAILWTTFSKTNYAGVRHNFTMEEGCLSQGQIPESC